MSILRRIATGSFAIGLSSLAFAKGDDVDFARALVREGYIDLATEYCERLLSSSSSTPEDKSGVQLIKAEIFAKEAQLADDPTKTQELLDKAVSSLEDFIKANAGHPRCPEAKFQIGVFLRQKGDFIVAQLKTAKAEDKASMRAEGDKNFKKAEEYFAALKDEFKKLKDEWFVKTNGRNPTEAEKKEEEDLTYLMMDAQYNEPRTLYSHCMLYEPGSKEKLDLTAKAIDLFMNFEFDYGDRMKAYESSIFWALTHKERGEFAQCYPRFEFTISLKEYFQGGEMPDDAREIITTGFYYKAMTHNEERKYVDAIKTVDDMMALLKDAASKERIGISAQLLKGDAYVGMGQSEKAMELGAKLETAAPTEGLKAMVRKRIADWAGSKGGGGLAVWLIKYRAAMDQGDFVAALAALQGAIAAAESSGSKDAIDTIPDLMWKMALIYDQELSRLYDAVIVYETIALDWQSHKLAPQAAFEAAATWNDIAAKIGTEKSWEKDQVAKNLTLLTSKWPKDPNAKNAQYLVAEALYQKGNYEEAAKEFTKVTEEANLYEQAQVRIGQANYDVAKKKWAAGDKGPNVIKAFNDAEKGFQGFLDYIKKNPAKTPALAERRPGVEAVCRQSLANLYMHEAMKKYDKAIEQFDVIESTDPDDATRLRIWRQRVTAYLALNNIDKAVELTESLLAKFKSAKQTMEACQLVGSRCDEEAEKIVGPELTFDKITPAALKYWELAAKYYANWIRVAIAARERIKPLDALNVADRIYNLGLTINQIDDKLSFTAIDLNALKNPRIFKDAALIYEPIANEDLGRDPAVDSGKLLLKMAYCYDFAQDWERARDAYETLMQSERIRNADGKTLNKAILEAKKWLFSAYSELGHVYLRLGDANINKTASLQEAYYIFANVVDRSEKGQEGWWKAKYYVIKILFEKGGQGDYELASIGIKDMRINYPNFDEDKFKMKASFEALEKAILDKAPKK